MMKTRDKYTSNIKSNMVAIGLMSGTSMDGVDVALMNTDGINNFDIKFFQSFSYSKEIKKIIKTFIKSKNNYIEVRDIITNFHAKCVLTFLKKYNFSINNIDIIGFHGQTIMHAPVEGWTWQIGSGEGLSNILKIPVVSNFRYRDICLGGEGAPLASLWHKILFSSLPNKNFPCIFLNIGGVSNITYIDNLEKITYCFDIGPGNGPIDIVMKQFFNQEIDYGGKKSLIGKIHYNIINKILDHNWLNSMPPKSLDRNELNSYIFKHLVKISAIDKLATLSRLISCCLKKHIDLLGLDVRFIYVSGGGCHNAAIMKGIKEECINKIKIIEYKKWDPDSIEAQAFAYLAVRSYKGLPLTVNNVTGINKDVSGGVLNFPLVK